MSAKKTTREITFTMVMCSIFSMPWKNHSDTFIEKKAVRTEIRISSHISLNFGTARTMPPRIRNATK